MPSSPAARRSLLTMTTATSTRLKSRGGWSICGDDLARVAHSVASTGTAEAFVVTNNYQSARPGERHEERFQSDGFRHACHGALRSMAEIHRQEIPRSSAYRS